MKFDELYESVTKSLEIDDILSEMITSEFILANPTGPKFKNSEDCIEIIDDSDLEFEDGEDFWNEYVDEDQFATMQIDEAIKRIKVVRHGKPTWKLTSTKPGYKIYHGAEVKLTKKEKQRRSLAAKKVSKRRSTIVKRKRTLKNTVAIMNKLRKRRF